MLISVKLPQIFKLTHLLFQLPGSLQPAGLHQDLLAASASGSLPHPTQGSPGSAHRAQGQPRVQLWNELCGNRAVRSGASPLACQQPGSSGWMLGSVLTWVVVSHACARLPPRVPGYPNLCQAQPVSIPMALPCPPGLSALGDRLEGTGAAHLPILSMVSCLLAPLPTLLLPNPQPHHPSFPGSTKVKAENERQHKPGCVQKVQQPRQMLWLSKRGNCNKNMILLK